MHSNPLLYGQRNDRTASLYYGGGHDRAEIFPGYHLNVCQSVII